MKLVLLFIPLIFFSCTATSENDYPGDLRNIEKYSLDRNTDTLLLKKDISFGDTEGVFYRSMGEFTVDDSGRVYVADAGWGSRSLHVYEPDGSYLKKISGEGKGPAEFLSLSNLQYNAGKVFFYDSQLQRIMLYSTKTLETVKTVLTDPRKWQDIPDVSAKRPHEFYLESNGTIVAAFEETPQPSNAGNRVKSYYRLNTELEIVSEELAELKAKRFVHSSSDEKVGNTQVRLMKHFPFFERHFFVPASSGQFYTVESSDFLIKNYDRQGSYMSALYYPMDSPKVTREDALRSANELVEGIAEDVELPESWPVINHVFMDDENRFWVSTITESNKYFKWWVLEESGRLLATFNWPGDKYRDPASLENHVVVKNGYFYQREMDEEDGAAHVVRYKIEFEERR